MPIPYFQSDVEDRLGAKNDIVNISELAHLTPVFALATKEEGSTWMFDLIRR